MRIGDWSADVCSSDLREVLDALGRQGVLINVARGSVVDEEALIAALRDGRLGAAGLDVFADEPRVPQALKDMTGNVVLQPHQGSATHDTRLAMGRLVMENLLARSEEHTSELQSLMRISYAVLCLKKKKKKK